MSSTKQGIEKLKEFLKSDASSAHPKFPEMALYTLKDERMVNAIAKRLEKNSTLIDIKALEYNFYSGLNHIFFEFSVSDNIGLKRDTILVIVDPHSNVVGVVDQFDPDHPNPFLPPISKLQKTYGEEPFVIDRPTDTDEITFTEEQLMFTRLRSKEFFDKIIAAQQRPPGDGGGGLPPGCDAHATRCYWETCYRVPWDPIPGCTWTQPDSAYDACDY
jgi:hypothetical protein